MNHNKLFAFLTGILLAATAVVCKAQSARIDVNYRTNYTVCVNGTSSAFLAASTNFTPAEVSFEVVSGTNIWITSTSPATTNMWLLTLPGSTAGDYFPIINQCSYYATNTGASAVCLTVRVLGYR